ncbi:sensor histidine kinase [Pontibacter chinhatensis]|uniref:Histidine kinase n=1 Tax=Pontibacter chinhatensis TaxID=1436961 RepID=A0A1I2X8I0_9BACT|nr:histidine kinase [Pontibacter chinhatensis]SFH09006.1 Histidine kinase [Pontibacter chinhatensis]
MLTTRHLIPFIWSILAAAILLKINMTAIMPFGASLLYVAVLVPAHIACAHLLADLALPRFMLRRQMFRFSLLVLVACAGMSVLLSFVDLWLEQLLHYRLLNFDGGHLEFVPRALGLFTGLLLTSSAICGIRFYTEHSRMEKKHQQLRAEHLEAELKLLRDQINPHFLFNVLNSIHVLMNKDTKKASQVLFQFADLLRYQLYECSQAAIPLEQEVSYLQNYVQIEQVRHGKELRLDTDWPTHTYGHTIAPFILAPFVENAFKHVSRAAAGGNFIQVRLSTEQQGQLRLEVWNSYDEPAEVVQPSKAGGLGLENVKKRLDLLYPGRHTLQFQQEFGIFRAKLDLHLSESINPTQTAKAASQILNE